MRIAIITSGYLPVLDGVTVSVHERVTRLAARNHQVLLLAPEGPGAAPPVLPQVARFVPLASRRFGGAAGDTNPLPSANTQIERELDSFGPDLIHVDEPERLAIGLRRVPAVAFGRRHNVPVVAFFHTNFIDYWGEGAAWQPLAKPFGHIGWRLVTRLYNRFDATLVPSQLSLRRLAEMGLTNGIAGPYNGVDTAVFSPSRRKAGYWGRRWNLPELDGRFVILIVGRLTSDKGWSSWRDALPQLGRRLGARLGVVVAGDGVLRDEVRTLLDAGPFCGRLLGAVPYEEMSTLMANADLYATMSRHENASLAVYEALASGLPVIATRSGGLPDQIRDGDNGLLFAPGDMRGFLDGVAHLAQNNGAATSVRKALLNSRASLDWEHAFDAWLAVVDRVRTGRRQGADLPR